jgi:hypothetical protein
VHSFVLTLITFGYNRNMETLRKKARLTEDQWQTVNTILSLKDVNEWKQLVEWAEAQNNKALSGELCSS